MKFSADFIASQIGGVVEGDGNVLVDSFCKIDEGHQGALSFLSNPKYTHYLYDTEASVVLVRRDFLPEKPVRPTLIRVDDPYQTLSVLLSMVDKTVNPQPAGVESPSFIAADVTLPDNVYVGAFAYIGERVRLGNNVRIYPHAYIGHDCEIGDDTIIYAGAKIYHSCKIGRRCIIHAGAVIGADGFGFAPLADGTYHKIPQMGSVCIADDVEVGANTTIDRAVMGATRIADGVKLDNLIQVAHNVEIGKNTVMAAQAGVAGSTKIGSGCMVGGQSGFAGHISVGDNVSIGAQSGIPNNVEDGARIMGYPAVPAADFARQTVYIKRLGQLFSQVRDLKKKTNS
ncbi:MAG: UDP-3-O-(3-hydroxymyristoyl)glucosamine N-acyltransferase [Muribaculaceae bacterium]|nr:UDP-3-O-(3-hydroxymyristoyl)glucosamine N-acyltransferase [Muribaculaceae bacterium]